MLRSLTKLALSSLLALSTIGATGCYVQDTGPGPQYAQSGGYVEGEVTVGTPTDYYPAQPAPEPIYEEAPPPPAYGYVWIDGYWNWGGGGWRWWRGHWEAPHEGYVYVQPYYGYEGGRYRYLPGHWNRPTALPRGVEVRDHRSDGRPPTAVWTTGNTYRVRETRVPSYSAPPPRGNTVVVPSQTNPPPPRGNTVVVPSQSYQPPPRGNTVVVPSQTNQPPPPRGNTVVVPAQRAAPPPPPPRANPPHPAPPPKKDK